jgi:aminopeptidase N
LGWETFQQILSTFYERWKFKHPRPQDFFDIANEVSGQDLTWFFDQVHRSAVDFDYAVRSVESYPLELKGYTEKEGTLQYVEPEGEADIYRTELVIGNNGLGTFPVEVLMVFEDGTEIRRDWDGAYRWKLFVEEGPAKLDYAVVDPDRKLVLDLSPTNNSQRLTPAADLPARKWSSKWMIWLQDLLTTFAFFM